MRWKVERANAAIDRIQKANEQPDDFDELRTFIQMMASEYRERETVAKAWELMFGHVELWKNVIPHMSFTMPKLHQRMVEFLSQADTEILDRQSKEAPQ